MADIVSVAEARRAELVGREVVVQGWVRTRRDSKAGFSFIELNDGSCFGNVQIVAETALPNYESEIKRLSPGSSASVTGLVKESPGKGQATEIHAASVEVHGLADTETYPLQKKGHSFEFLRTIAHLRPRTNTFGAVARVRNCASNSIHQYFQEQGFIYVHTPIITTSDCEGAGAMFQVTSLDLEKSMKSVKCAKGDGGEKGEKGNEGGGIDFSQDFFGRRAFLTVSGQLEAETYACGLGKTYTFGPTFRAENSNTPRHLAEFWMVEPEVAFCDLWGDMELAEGLLKRIFRDALEKCPEDMEFFNQRIDKTVIETLQHIVESDFLRVSYTDAVEVLQKSGRKFEYPTDWGNDLQSEHERFLTEEHFHQPVILYDYPRQIKAVLHASERRRPDGSGDGRARAQDRRDHRRQPTRGTNRYTRTTHEGAGPRPRALLVVSRPSPFRNRAARRFRLGTRAGDTVHHRNGEHSRRNPISPLARQRGILNCA